MRFQRNLENRTMPCTRMKVLPCFVPAGVGKRSATKTYRMNEFDMRVEEIRKHNSFLLERFEKKLKDKKMTKSTLDRHVENVDFYINDSLLYCEPSSAKEGTSRVGYFLGDLFKRKAM